MLSLGNICAEIRELSFLPLKLDTAFSKLDNNPVPVKISQVNGREELEFKKYEVDETFKTCTEIWRPPINGHTDINGTLGYIVAREAAQSDSIFIFSNYHLSTLEYNTFPCPDQAK